MTGPLFSIVIPTYNRSDLVRQAIQSVLNQTFEDFEIVVSDNCSNDDTPDVVRSFSDPRVRYVRTVEHTVIADNWEFARRQARGEFLLMLSDDDALIGNALESFARESQRHEADFLFCSVATYHDLGFPGSERNTLSCPSFSGIGRVISPDEFVRPLFAFRPRFNMHPSAFLFAKRIGDLVAERSGRFFRTNGVEYFAWPLAAVFSKRIVLIDMPLVILGRTGKSWGSNLVLCNPGKDRIKELTSDVEQQPHSAPLTNFAISNLMGDGMLTAKKLFPKELEKYEFDEEQYLRETMKRLRERKSVGVDVSGEIAELMSYLSKHPSLKEELSNDEQNPAVTIMRSLLRRLRSTIADCGVRDLRKLILTRRQAWNVKRGQAHIGLRVSGADFGFHDMIGCTEFLTRAVMADQKFQSVWRPAA